MPDATNTTTTTKAKHESCLPAETQKYLRTARDELVKARLGGVGRRFQMAGETLHEGIAQFGGPIAFKLGDSDVKMPVEVTATLRLDVKVGDKTASYEYAVGSVPTARAETPLTSFPSASGPSSPTNSGETVVVRSG